MTETLLIVFALIGGVFFFVVAACEIASKSLLGRTTQMGRCCVSLVLCFISVVSMLYLICVKPERHLRQLLAGSKEHQVSSLVIASGSSKIAVNDPAALQYLTQAFRSAVQGESCGGYTWDADFYMSSGGSVQCAIVVPDDPSHLMINFVWDLVPDRAQNYYLVELPQPIPETLAKALSQVRQGTHVSE